MNFIDEVINYVKAGDGGCGKVAFRREKYVPYGGPSGGNGGNGGSIIFVGVSGENNLFKLKYRKKIKALNGYNGENKNKNGANAPDLFIEVPLGVSIYNHTNNQLIGEILEAGERLIIARGGKGGKGNFSLANHLNSAPSYAEKGDLGESLIIRTELKMLADVGLLGFPNVGKSSLLAALSNAKPKISSYPFTTLTPCLGMVFDKKLNFVIADIPGLIENASLGRGQGINFLKHIERCKLLLHICDASNDDIYSNYLLLNEELKKYHINMLKKPQIIVVNKKDLSCFQKNFLILTQQIKDKIIMPISVINYLGLTELKNIIIEHLQRIDLCNINTTANNIQDKKIFTLNESVKFIISKESNGCYVVAGDYIEKLFHRTDFNNHESISHFSYILKKIGVEEELKKRGMRSSDQVKICNCIFEFVNETNF
ncbi:GTPase ObgE ['Opuntia sp.' phytoplasma]|uniref:GTPase Obg n=1 Tax=Candidatus Phytoplasma asiaticum TaxID=2763338 RepID=A0AAX3B9P5_9MOLU|nr:MULTISPECIES: GTPase ObgE [Phytoplasma]MDO8053903.1 GTPase ObgE ['Opuntia sp.' phytoplasma]MDO8057711.1 GTPase ObgE ['Opuntia sp.' phytoplasma]UQV27346.1 GTPase ObgE ['Parthenium hysterophorus' phyllody phytoplasma]